MIYTVTLNPAVDKQITVPTVSLGTVLRASAVQSDPGGKGFNVSRALKMQDVPSCALGFVGGATGDFLVTALEELGIKTDFVRVAEPTRTNVSVVSETEGPHLKVNEAGPTIDANALDLFLSKVRDLAQAGDWWVLAGSLPPGVPTDIYTNLTAVLSDAGANVVVDTSGSALKSCIDAKPALIKPNHHEAAALLERSIDTLSDAAEAALQLHNGGIPYVVISMGAEGAVLATNGVAHIAEAPEIVERNPIGAGDSMVAGLVNKLSAQLPAADALAWGIATGAMSASLDGTAFGSSMQIAELVKQVELEHYGEE